MKSIFDQISGTIWLQGKFKNLLGIGRQIRTTGQPLIDYGISIKEVGLNLCLHLFFFFMGLFTLLYFIKVLWSAYQSSPVGQKYTQFFVERSYLISDFLSQNLFDASLKIIWIPFYTCFLICCALRLFHITSFLYHSRRGMIQVLFFGIPLTLISGWNLYQTPLAVSFKQGVVLSFLPTMYFFKKCFYAADQLIPELRDLLWGLKEILGIVKKKLKRDSMLGKD